MIRVVAKVLVKKDKKDAFVEACRELVQASRQDEGNKLKDAERKNSRKDYNNPAVLFCLRT